MGMVISYYVIDDELIKRTLDENFDLIEYIHDKLIQSHEYKNQEFERCGIRFGTGVKAWNPTIELLKLLDTSENKIMSTIFQRKLFGGIDSLPYSIDSSKVKLVWSEIKKVSLDTIESASKSLEVKNRIKNFKGYRMDAIDNTKLIVLEFIEIFKAFYEAQDRNKAIVINIS